jgi:MFS family permease
LPLAIAFSTVSPVLPMMAVDLAHGPSDAYLVKMVVGIMGISIVIGGPLSGLLADKVPRRPLLAVSGLVFALAGFAPYFLQSLSAILLSRFVMGLAGTSIHVSGAAMVGDYFSDAERPRWMGRFAAVSMIGGVVTLLLAGWLGDRGWRDTFLIYLVGIPFALLAVSRSTGAVRSDVPVAAAAATSDSETSTSRFPFGLTFLALLMGLITFVPSIYIPFHLAKVGIRSPSSIAALLTISVVVSSLVATQFGRARQLISAAGAFCCSFAAMTLAIAMVALSMDYQLALVGLVFMGLGVAWMSPNLMASAVAAVDARHRGRTLGIVRAAHSVAPAIGVAMVEPLVSRIGVEGILIATSALAAAMLIGTAVSARGRFLSTANAAR